MSFPIIPITEDMILQEEQLGTKDKFWCRRTGKLGPERWLFKQPRQQHGNIEHLTEKIVCEVGQVLRISCAQVDFAQFEGQRGTVSRNFVAARHELVHGNELIAGRVTSYDLEQKHRTSEHTWEKIEMALRSVAGDNAERFLADFAGYLVLDALVGNSDRHHENWGVIRRAPGARDSYILAPSFDHASSLGREMLDERRTLFLQEARISQYLWKARGGIYLEASGGRPLSPIALVESLAATQPRLFRPWLQNLQGVTDDAVYAILQQIPPDWMTAPQAEFAAALIRESRHQLVAILSK